MFLQIVVNGLLLGGLYALMGTGFSLQWGISGIPNVAYGTLTLLGAYIAFYFWKTLGIQPITSFLSSGLGCFILGFFVYWFLLRRVLRYGSFILTLIACFAVGLVIQNFILLVWASDYRLVPSPFLGRAVLVGTARVPITGLIVFCVSLLCVWLAHMYLSKTRTGKAIQAAALNPEGAAAVGINIQRMYAINFGLGSALAGIAGALMSTVQSFSVIMDPVLLGKVFAIAVLGGLGNIWGTFLGGMSLGLVEAFVGSTLPRYAIAAGLILLILVLIVRPQGFLGRKYWWK